MFSAQVAETAAKLFAAKKSLFLALLSQLLLTCPPGQAADGAVRPGYACPSTESKIIDFSLPRSFATGSAEFQFDYYWPQIKRFESQLEQMIDERLDEISHAKEEWRPKIDAMQIAHSQFYAELEAALESGTLSRIEEGNGSAYLLKNARGKPVFVIKPCDEGILCLFNPKHHASPFNERAFRLRTHIPLYRTAQTEALAYEVACALGLKEMTPETHLALISHPAFYGNEREKFCSVQRYIPDSTSLLEAGVPPQMTPAIFEDLMLFIWCIYDTDGHAGNFTISRSSADALQLMKIDNGLSFPDENANLFNVLVFLPYAALPLSTNGQEKLQNIPVKQIVERMHFYGMDSAIPAFQERIAHLQKLSKQIDLSLAEVEIQLRIINNKSMISRSVTSSKWR